jgi:general secretion pathway protein F
MIFSYTAFNLAFDFIKGEVQAVEKSEALKKIRMLNLVPVDVKESRGTKKFKLGTSLRPRNVTKEDLMLATREIAVMLKAGIPILRAIRILIEANADKKLGEVLGKICEDIKRGEALASAMENEKKYFSHVIINMVRTGEKSGQLPEVLLNISKDLEHSLAVTSEVRNALAYPVFLLTMSGFALFFIFTFVIPKFTLIIEKLNVELPGYSRFVLKAGTFMKSNIIPVLILILICLVTLSFLRKKERIRYWFNRALLKVPGVKNLIVELEMSRFSHALAVLLNSGVEIIQSIRMANESVANAFLRKSLSGVALRLKKGESLHASIKEVALFPQMAVSMIEVGEESGKLVDILEEISALFMEKFRNTMKRFISLLEPVIITGVGIVIGFIVISILSAIMSLNEIRL